MYSIRLNLVVAMKVVYIFILVLPVLLMVAFFTVFERVIIGNIQRRTGRNLVG